MAVDVTPLIGAGRQVIQSYGPGRFRINGTLYETPVFVRPDRTAPWAGEFAATGDFVQALEPAEDRPEILLLGCGARMETVAPEVRQALRGRGIALEVMDTGAACRTYNVLMAEGRLVAAALIPLPR